MARFGMASMWKGEREHHRAAGTLLTHGLEHVVEYHYRETTHRTGAPVIHLTAWCGKSNTPRINSVYTSMEKVYAALNSIVAAESAHADRKAQRKAESAQRAILERDRIQVGTILVNSWGYEQTNVDFYLVIAKSGAMVDLQRIGARTIEATGPMSSRVAPDPSVKLCEKRYPVIRKRIGAYGVSFEHGSCSVTTPDSSHYCSWYY